MQLLPVVTADADKMSHNSLQDLHILGENTYSARVALHRIVAS